MTSSPLTGKRRKDSASRRGVEGGDSGRLGESTSYQRLLSGSSEGGDRGCDRGGKGALGRSGGKGLTEHGGTECGGHCESCSRRTGIGGAMYSKVLLNVQMSTPECMSKSGVADQLRACDWPGWIIGICRGSNWITRGFAEGAGHAYTLY